MYKTLTKYTICVFKYKKLASFSHTNVYPIWLLKVFCAVT